MKMARFDLLFDLFLTNISVHPKWHIYNLVTEIGNVWNVQINSETVKHTVLLYYNINWETMAF